MGYFKDVHDPVIDRASWEKVQQKRGKIRSGKTKRRNQYFSGLLVCATAVTSAYHFNQGKPGIKYFNCPITKVIVVLVLLPIISVSTF